LERLRLKVKCLLEKDFNPHQIEFDTKRAANDELDFALGQKRKLLKETTHRDYTNRLGHFKKFLDKKGMLHTSIYEIKRKHINQFLNEILVKSVPRNRNNTRMALSSLFSVLEENDIIEVNFVKSIKPLKVTPTRNKTYSLGQADEIFKWIEKTNPHLCCI
jgi:integrase